ncbi:phage distal tail protein [Nonomuraea wenchangensis]|uniref:Phage tail protein n=1 Tax=Nonomuraea wenchangensis TaxID=568860 RepID=A0A1I0ES81_9ACTN|nr:phage tail domain-containing protein [Nonomuraea wenchangensis]SET47958.1 Phage tail protein [Nonomuraea wenchangensis]
MARAGRSYPNRPSLSRHPRNWDQSRTLGIFETVSEWPPVSVETPNANLFLGPFETTSEWPGLEFAYDYHPVLPVFETTSEWPSPGVSVPIKPGDSITGSYQIEYNGTLFGGHGNIYQIIGVEGWDDLPGMDSSNVSRPTWHGSWPGRYRSQERQVTATLAINVGDGDDFAGAVATLRRLLTPPASEAGQPLVVSTRDEVLMVPEAVVDTRAMPMASYHVGWVQVSVRWICADPRRYNVVRSGVAIPPGSTADVENAGNVASHPLLRVDGPVVNPVITNPTLERTLSFLLTVPSGQRLTIDTDAGNATVNGESVLSTLTGASAPVADFVLERDTNVLTFAADSGGTTGLTVLYRDAWL